MRKSWRKGPAVREGLGSSRSSEKSNVATAGEEEVRTVQGGGRGSLGREQVGLGDRMDPGC